MKLEVFDYLIAIEKYGSLSKAAEHLYVSQPNLTNVIRALEGELGYAILTRNNRGVAFTEQGRQALLIARNIVRERDKLGEIGAARHSLNLRLSIGNDDNILAALCEDINRLDAQCELHLTILNLPVMEALEKVYSRQLDLAYMIVPTSMDRELESYGAHHGLMVAFFEKLVCQITLREGHPLLRDGFSREALWNYPFVDYADQYPNAYGVYQQYINPRRRIMVDHHSLRVKLVRETDAFTIGIFRPSLAQSRDGLVQLPTPDLYMHLAEVRRVSDLGNGLYNALRSRVAEGLTARG